MAHRVEVAQIREELVDAFKFGEEERARSLLSQLDLEPWGARALLEAMLEDEDSLVRQAAAFGLGELGGTDSVRRLDQQLLIEEARGDYDGEAVVEDIVRALGRIPEPEARACLIRRLARMAAGSPELSDLSFLALALWRRRSPDLIAPVRQALERLALGEPHALHGLRVLLEKSPEELCAWALDPTVPVEFKTRVLVVLEEEVPKELEPILPAFIFAARPLVDEAAQRKGEEAYYCERLFRLLSFHRERLLAGLPPEARSSLRAVARGVVGSPSINCASQAVSLLAFVGEPEDAALIEAHSPTEPRLALKFRDAARALRGPQGN